VRFAPTDEQAAMADAVRDVLAAECTPAVVRAAWDDDGAAARALMARLGDAGLLALLVGEDRGGLGLDAATLAPVLEQVGYAAAPAPVVDTVAVAAPLLAAAGHPRTEEVLAGRLLVASGLGRAGLPIPHAQIAELFLLETDDGPRVLASDEVEVAPLDAVDGARRLARVRPLAAGLEIGADDGLAATLGVAAELIGLGQRMLDLTVEYVGQREQFGKPVGAFQAVKHQLADACSAVAFARPAVRRAGATLAAGWDTAARDVAVAKATAADAADLVSRRAMQCHGAIGYTVEYDLHLYAKRAWALLPDRGDAVEHRGHVADDLGIPATVAG
jgi:alkylation response protein AidB-like acyl-CoA dehydrogenase